MAELDLENMVGGMMDSDNGKIAQEVAGSLDMESMFGSIDESTNPMELMSQMMDPNKMEIFQNINTVMERKVEHGELNTDTLKKEAEGMVWVNVSKLYVSTCNGSNAINRASTSTSRSSYGRNK